MKRRDRLYVGRKPCSFIEELIRLLEDVFEALFKLIDGKDR